MLGDCLRPTTVCSNPKLSDSTEKGVTGTRCLYCGSVAVRATRCFAQMLAMSKKGVPAPNLTRRLAGRVVRGRPVHRGVCERVLHAPSVQAPCPRDGVRAENSRSARGGVVALVPGWVLRSRDELGRKSPSRDCCLGNRIAGWLGGARDASQRALCVWRKVGPQNPAPIKPLLINQL